MYDVKGFCVTDLQVVGNFEYAMNCKRLLIKNILISLHCLHLLHGHLAPV